MTDADVAAARSAFETVRARWNVVRTVSATAALAALAWAALQS